jgi:hypothetical protein
MGLNIFRELDKHGMSGLVIAIIILVVGLALVVLFIIFAGQETQGGVASFLEQLNIIRHGGR